MLKMYEAEVLGKLPVIQHFLFGSLLPWDGPPPQPGSPTAHSHSHTECGHAHPGLPPNVVIHPSRLQAADAGGELGAAGQRGVGWGDCCGIPVPSVFGAAAAEKSDARERGRWLEGAGIRPVPFD